MNHPYTFKELTTTSEMIEQLSIIQQLQPSLTLEAYKQMLPEMIPNGYSQVIILDDNPPSSKKDFGGQSKCIGISGIWINTKLYSGKYLEMDNVVIDKDYRSKGIGKLLCDWCINKAKETNCKNIMLDAYLENEKAHAFYEREGFTKRGYHFIKNI